MSLQRLTRTLELVSKETGFEIQIITLLVFLFVASRGRCSQKDVEQELKLTNASTSRNISYWTDRRFDRKPGMGFIERVENDYDRRVRELALTPRGEAFYRRLKAEFTRATPAYPATKERIEQ